MVVGQHRAGGAAAGGTAEDLIGADEAQATAAEISAEDTVPLDEGTLREIFGEDEPK